MSAESLNAEALSPHFRRCIEALVLVSPLAIASRYENGFNHCVEASVAGAEVLRRRRINAKAVPCAVIAHREDDASALTIGLTARHLYDRVGDEKTPFDVWKERAADQVPDKELPHEVIRASFGKVAVIIDLTLGQLRGTGAPDADKIPLRAWSIAGDWAAFEAPPWTIEYIASPLDPVILAKSNVNKFAAPGLVQAFSDMMDLAIKLDLDPERLNTELSRQQPESYVLALKRIAALSTPG